MYNTRFFNEAVIATITNKKGDITTRLNLWCKCVLQLHENYIIRITEPEYVDQEFKNNIGYDRAAAAHTIWDLFFECCPSRCADPEKTKYIEAIHDARVALENDEAFLTINYVLYGEGGLIQMTTM